MTGWDFRAGRRGGVVNAFDWIRAMTDVGRSFASGAPSLSDNQAIGEVADAPDDTTRPNIWVFFAACDDVASPAGSFWL